MRKTGLVSVLLLSTALAVPSPAPASVQPASPPVAQANNDIEELGTFMDVYERVKARYVKDVDAHTLIKGAIDGMLSALDPHSSYAEGSDFDDLQTISDGDYGGLGVVTTVDGGFIRVVSTTEDAPAWKAG